MCYLSLNQHYDGLYIICFSSKETTIYKQPSRACLNALFHVSNVALGEISMHILYMSTCQVSVGNLHCLLFLPTFAVEDDRNCDVVPVKLVKSMFQTCQFDALKCAC